MDELIILEEGLEEDLDLETTPEDVLDITEEPEEEISLEEEVSFVLLDYRALRHKPSINGELVIDDKTIEQYGMEEITNSEIESMMQD